MRFAAAILMLLAASSTGRSQALTQPPETAQPAQVEVRIRSLNIVSESLPQADRERVIRSLDGHGYVPGEFEERTRMGLRNLGYYYTRVEDAELTQVRDDKVGKSADVVIKVVPGDQYRLRFIEFRNETVFKPERLRSQFPLQTGDLFCSSSVAYGLQKLMKLYQGMGHINIGAVPIPAIDEVHHTIDLTIDIDEGKSYVFGSLVLSGVEPHAGTGKALVESWKTVQGKAYDPEALKAWMTANFPSAGQEAYGVQVVDTEPWHVNVLLQFP
jgi:hypothetical protein